TDIARNGPRDPTDKGDGIGLREMSARGPVPPTSLEGLPMRLTLRTLLAWLDDTLPPAEVRQIGHQVSDSPFAPELVERIHRVSRQRRLTVPNSSVSDGGADPNVVAAYLDNELPPDQVAEYEKLCLASDVNLAEVASAHQILSLIGQRAKVPTEARSRMYRLIKGRETDPHRASARGKPGPLTEALAPC